jgi:two-component system, NarL family, sensor histidine kinase DesK
MAWALREAITNVVKHSGAQMCWITVHSVDGSTSLEVEDDGGGPGEGTFGTGLNGLADRIHGLGGSLTAERREQCGFRLWVQLGSVAATPPIGVRAG